MSREPAARIAATMLLAVVALAVLASPAVAGTTHSKDSSPEPGLSRHVIMQAAMDGAVVMSLLTTGLLVFGRVRKPGARPKPQRVRLAEPDRGDRSSETSYSSWLAETVPYFPPDDDSGTDDWDADPGPAAPSWLGLAGPLGSPDQPAAPPAPAAPPGAHADAGIVSDDDQPAAVDVGASTDEEPSWPEFLALASDTEQATAPSYATDSYSADSCGTDSYAAEPHDGRQRAEPSDGPRSPDAGDARRDEDPQDVPRDHPDDHAELAESGFSTAALRILGARPMRERGNDDMPPQRYQVALGDDRIDVVLTEAPAVGQASRPRAGNTWLAATPYLLWAPLPYDAPDDGLAFACIGAGDEGCLFIDLGAAPGAVVIDGDADSAVRLAESIAHQLCARVTADQAISVLSVGRAIPEPRPASARPVATLRDLASASLDSPPDNTDIVFCELRTNEDAFVLARHVRSSRRRVVPVVLGHLPGAAWSFTAHQGHRLDGALPPLVSSLAGSPSR